MVDIKSYLDPQLRKIIASKKQVAVIPVGSIEQHGPHLPISTDSDIVTEVSRKICQKNNYLLLPTLNFGVSQEHAPFFNLSLKEITLQKILSDLCLSLYENNVKTIFIINGHHGNIKLGVFDTISGKTPLNSLCSSEGVIENDFILSVKHRDIEK